MALHAQRRDNLLARIELTADQLTPPSLDREEDAITDNSTHDQALTKLRDYLWLEFDEKSPRLYVRFARWFERVKSIFCNPRPDRLVRGEFNVSIAEPDKLGTADVSVKDDIAQSLMTQKKRAVAILAQHVRDATLSERRRRHAAQTLEMISGRRFHSKQKLDEARRLLTLHGE